MVYIQRIELSPAALDAQSPIKIDEWVVVNSDKHKETDEDYLSSEQMLLTGAENGFLKVDNLGRIWARGPGEEFLPYHYDSKTGNQFLGLRILAFAVN